MHGNNVYTQLLVLNYSGTFPEMWRTWLKDAGVAISTLPQMEMEWLSTKGFEGTLPDRWMAYFLSLGLTGTINDMSERWQLPPHIPESAVTHETVPVTNNDVIITNGGTNG